MPVPTDTFWNIRKLNRIFALTAVILLLSVLWLVVKDYTRPWRDYQRQARVWDVALTRDAARHAMSDQALTEYARLEKEIKILSAALPHAKIKQLQAKIDATRQAKTKLDLPAAKEKSLIGPLNQQIEKAALEFGPEAPQTVELKRELARVTDRYNRLNDQIVAAQMQSDADAATLKELEKQRDAIQKNIDNLIRNRKTALDKLAKLDPKGLAILGEQLRNAPLLDWMNPSENVQQVIVPGVRTDLNFLTTDTIDRCNSCHVNIDKPAYEETNLLLFAERQLAAYQKQPVEAVNHPAVLLDFWENAAAALAAQNRTAAQALSNVRNQALDAVNAVRRQAGLDALKAGADLPREFARIVTLREPDQAERAKDAPSLQTWYAPLGYYLADLKNLLLHHLGKDEFAKLRTLYRQQLITAYNNARKDNGLPELSANPVLLGHPHIDLYVDAESKHPMKTMGCTVCHEGSGEETDFTHVAHTPTDDMWVDAHTGATVPEFLQQRLKKTANSLTDAPAAVTGAPVSPAVYSQYDVNLVNPHDPAPLAPLHDDAGPSVSYIDPLTRQVRTAVRQAAYWTEKYHWEKVPHTDWERPMHALEYIESSCNKCHTQVFDLEKTAPRLFEGRTLFAQMGCVNCHAVDSLKTALDIKKIGPSLVHIHAKLSPQMTASWIWSPKAFRPTTRMPHFFMLENNSAPVDILRTRVEVAAITYYLMTTPPPAAAPGTSPTAANVYQPQAPPKDPGNVQAGRALFNSVGCLACHTNLAEQGQQWITADLTQRAGLTPEQAAAKYKGMSYNQRHWYALEYLGDKITRFGPELSAIGTKLQAGRTPEQARTWVYNWIRNPKGFSHTTFMPNLRLTEQEANDLSAYLLSLERSDYQPDSFGFTAAGQFQPNAQTQAMLKELVATLLAGQSTKELALARIEGKEPGVKPMTVENQLSYLGKKSIGYYGCNGCHAINGFENAVSACTDLNDWGLKDPHKLDFGYFDRAYDQEREKPLQVWKVPHEGLGAAAPQLLPETKNPKLETALITLKWEDMDLERRPWLYNKLHNPRIYDRGRSMFEGSLNGEHIDIGRPYDKLKMPKFFLTDEQVRALVTFVTSIRKPLVEPELQRVADEPKLREIQGRELATRYNCYGCHNIEGNTPHIQWFYDVLDNAGRFNGNYDALNNAPPRLIGQGAKTQPQWLVYFLQNVHPLRPWLKVRMPSFFTAQDEDAREDTQTIAAYFAGWSKAHADKLIAWLADVDKYRQTNPTDRDWFTRPNIGPAVAQLRNFALTLNLAQPRDFDPRQNSPDDLRAFWNSKTNAQGQLDKLGLLDQLRFLAGLYDVSYPFPNNPHPQIDDARFARGQALFNELRCYQCHALGDEQTLIKLYLRDNPQGVTTPAAPAKPDDSYDDYGDSGGKKTAPAKPKSGNDDYGADESTTPAPAAAPARPLTPYEAMMAKYSAPNLSFAYQRLQWNWVNHWLQEPATIQPGTKMPQWFPQARSAFHNFPDDARKRNESFYGPTGPEQMRLLMDFIYAAGWRNYTPESEKLNGAAVSQPESKPNGPPPSIHATTP